MRISENELRRVIRSIIIEEQGKRPKRETMPMTAADFKADGREPDFAPGSEEDMKRQKEKAAWEEKYGKDDTSHTKSKITLKDSKKAADEKADRIRKCATYENSSVRDDGRRVFYCDGELYCYDTKLPMWVFDGKSLSQHVSHFVQGVKSLFNK